jgi:alpha-tubulin suppressor-like RCC1 family protein
MVGVGSKNQKQVMALSCFGNHAVAVLRNGTAAAWGANDLGQINVPGSAQKLNAVAAVAAGGSFTAYLLKNGTLVTAGATLSGV